MRAAKLAIVILMQLSAGLAFAQINTGLIPFGSFSGGPDVVDLSTLNVYLPIPIVSKAGRGVSFRYQLSYNTTIWASDLNGSIDKHRAPGWDPVHLLLRSDARA